MSPRPYRLGQRQVAADETRTRILDAARDQLARESSFSIEAVARRADVARMTVYNQFESKAGLLEALFDALAASGPFAQMPDIFRQPDPIAALDAFVGVLSGFR